MTKLLTLSLAVVAATAFVGPVAAQQERQAQNAATWKLATVDAKGIVHCEKDGWTCATSFLSVAGTDAGLARYTARINALLDELRDQAKNKNLEPVFVVTPYVPFLAWCRCKDKEDKEGKEGKEDRGVSERAIALEESPDRFYQTLGISRAMASYQKTESRWWYQTPDGIYWCRISGNTQLAAALLRADMLTPSHDQLLADYTNRINAILEEAAGGKSAPEQVLSLLVTRKGLLLAWSQNDNGTGPLPKGSITAHD
ncbi:MAG: hypothetical protein A3F84_28455 [Candidatus Handelsmanbacteria bacterium RIFCSPLOWO2_12_FULL_64_10]|uniref:Uncharacterized protein n=1 Tax=Handelsmanbacteria sp. (strain RIFCSPLOWO2_12_FULL_64_10) TaxID=1817868 RepID=A0A1F6CLD2_HANXR|nr:MAG: hypothetical protein A3F84_28455 [Candidatus Handelsmanbacteria bacterium RIFCSPLOWO2_12_FULL_64_10]